MTIEIMRTQNTTKTKELYFQNLCEIIRFKYPNKNNMDRRYEQLLRLLYSIEYIPACDMDNNRVADACEFRARWEEHTGNYVGEMIFSVLEVLIALSVRVEFNIMNNEKYGDRTGLWFWEMMANTGIDIYDDTAYDETAIRVAVNHAMSGRIDRDGNGGFFVVESSKYDMRKGDLWKQFMWYLTQLYEE